MRNVKKIVMFAIIAATCFAALCLSACSGCRDSSKSGTNAHIHNYIAVETAEPTCTERGYTLYACECGDSYEGDFTDARHTFSAFYASSACDGEGEYVFRYCTVCGEVETSGEDDLHPHDYELQAPYAPTCVRPGSLSQWFACKNCGASVVDEYIAPLGHKPGGNYVSSNGISHYRVCTRSGCSAKIYSSHRFSSYRVIRARTCTDNGAATVTCRDCGYVKNIVLYASHDLRLGDWINEPTCTEVGLREANCERCSFTTAVERPSLGHDFGELIVTLEPDCTHDGKGYRECKRCGKREDETLRRDHVGKWIIVIEPTCYTYGEMERECTRCGAKETRKIPPKHNFGTPVTVTEPTCTEGGVDFRVCTVCGYGQSIDTEPLGHQGVKEKKEATCTEGGYEAEVCSRCGEILEVYKETSPLGHYLPTYSFYATGHWKKCRRNGCVYETEKEEHTLELNVKTEHKNGEYLHIFGYMCKCGYVSDEKSVLHEHEATEIIEATATCIQPGLSAGLKCAVVGCGEILVAPIECDALGHLFVDGTCLRCGLEDYDSISTVGLEYKYERGYYVVSGIGTANVTDIVIPRTHNGISVRAIDVSAFARTRITSVTVPESIVDIRQEAFAGCEALTRVVLNLGLEYIGEQAFEECTALKSINIPDSVAEIRAGAFSGCSYLADVDLPSGLSELSDGLFGGCESLRNITLPNSVTVIGSAFFGCIGLQNIVIPNGVTVIGSSFAGCIGLKSIVIPNGVTVIGSSSFAGCTGLQSITIPNGISYLGENAFSGCDALSGTLYGNAYYLGNSSNRYLILFKAKDYGITSCTVHSATKLICENAFANCYELAHVSLGSADTYIDRVALINNYLVEYNKDGVSEYVGTSQSPYGVLISTEATEIVMRDETEAIADNALAHGKFTSFTIGKNVASIGDRAFYGAEIENLIVPRGVTGVKECWSALKSASVENLRFEGTLSEWCALGGLENLTARNLFIGGEKVTENLVIPSGVTSIAPRAFAFCAVKNLTLPRGFKIIGEEAFGERSSVVSTNFEGDIAEWCAVKGLPHLMNRHGFNSYIPLYINGEKVEGELVIPSGVTAVEDEAFICIEGVTGLTLPSSLKRIGKYAFAGSAIKTVNYLGDFADLWRIDGCEEVLCEKAQLLIRGEELSGDIVVPSGVTEIPDYAFYCSKITGVVVPQGVVSIGVSAFESCKKLKSAILPEGLKTMGERAFYMCSALTEISVPSSLEKVGQIAFSGCFVLGYTQYDGAYYIGNAANPYVILLAGRDYFTDSESVTSCKIHADTKIIYNYAFASYKNLSHIDIPESVTDIGCSAFEDCALTAVVIPDGVTEVCNRTFASDTVVKRMVVPKGIAIIYENLSKEWQYAECTIFYGTMDEWMLLMGDIPMWDERSGNASVCKVYCADGVLAYGAQLGA